MQAIPAKPEARKMKGIPGTTMDNFHVEMPNFQFAMPDVPKAMMSWRSSVPDSRTLRIGFDRP